MKLIDVKPGMIVRSKSSGDTFMVVANYGTRLTAVRTADIQNPPEWEIVAVNGQVIAQMERN